MMNADNLKRVWGMFQSEKIGQENLLEHLRRIPSKDSDAKLLVLTENLLRDTKEILHHLDGQIATAERRDAAGATRG